MLGRSPKEMITIKHPENVIKMENIQPIHKEANLVLLKNKI